MEKNKAIIFMGAMNLLSINGPMLASQKATTFKIEKKVDELNIASIKSIESSWLKIPNICKARGFNANPVELENKEIASYIQSIYATFES